MAGTATLTVTIVKDNAANFGPIPSSQLSLVISAGTYTLGGYAITNALCGFGSRTLAGVLLLGQPTALIITDGFFAVFNSTTGKLQLFGFAAATVAAGPLWEELPDTTTLTTAPYTIPARAFAQR